MKDLQKLLVVFTSLMFVSCANIKNLENENLIDVFNCTYLPNNSLKTFSANECKDYLYNLKTYDISKFYEKGGFSLILQVSEYHHSDFSFEMLDKFIAMGGDINYLNPSQPSSGLNALMTASLFEQPHMIKYLLAKGADVCIKDNKGKTAMDYLTPKNKSILTSEKQANIDKIKPMLQEALKKKKYCKH